MKTALWVVVLGVVASFFSVAARADTISDKPGALERSTSAGALVEPMPQSPPNTPPSIVKAEPAAVPAPQGGAPPTAPAVAASAAKTPAPQVVFVPVSNPPLAANPASGAPAPEPRRGRAAAALAGVLIAAGMFFLGRRSKKI